MYPEKITEQKALFKETLKNLIIFKCSQNLSFKQLYIYTQSYHIQTTNIFFIYLIFFHKAQGRHFFISRSTDFCIMHNA